MATMNKRGQELYNKWDAIYRAELEKLRAEKNDPEYQEGWCIIDDYEHVKTLKDEVGLLVFGYDDCLNYYFDEWRDEYASGEGFFRDVYGREYTLAEVEAACAPYYDDYKCGDVA